MPDIRLVARAHVKSIVDWFGCYDAVAETINARWGAAAGTGGVSRGTISKKVAGQFDWTISDVIALEDASGRYPVTKLLARRLEDRPAPTSGSLLNDGSIIARESGEAICAILSAEQSSSADDRAGAVKEIDDAIEALKAARVRLEAGR